MRPQIVDVIIPALDEERSIGQVLRDIPPSVRQVIVVDNGSVDGTALVASASGAVVISETRRGYGQACLTGVDYLSSSQSLAPTPDTVVFLDADYSDHPDELGRLTAPIERGRADLVIGSRTLGMRSGLVEPGALLPQARYGNMLATSLIRAVWGVRFTDLGPFRAIRFNSLLALGMRDADFGWTVEMQIRAVKAGMRIEEVPVSYRKRTGVSKITGTLLGTVRAGGKILYTIARHMRHSHA